MQNNINEHNIAPDHIDHKIVNDTQFKNMVRSRNRFALWLSLIVLTLYFIFIGVASFNPQLLAQSWGDRVMTIGMPIAALVIVISWLITGLYIYVTNLYFDKIKAQLKVEYQYE